MFCILLTRPANVDAQQAAGRTARATATTRAATGAWAAGAGSSGPASTGWPRCETCRAAARRTSATGRSAAGIAEALAHGLVGGTGSKPRAGRCRDGFFAGAFSQAASASGVYDRLSGGTSFQARVGRVAIAAAIGGTAAVAVGGDPAIGALMAAYSRFLNEEAGNAFSREAFNERYGEIVIKGKININANLTLAAEIGAAAEVDAFKAAVQTNGIWDYKYRLAGLGFDSDLLQEFGNVHFGMVAAAYGFSLGMAVVGAGYYQTFHQDNSPLAGLFERDFTIALLIYPESVVRNRIINGEMIGDNPGDASLIM